MATIYKDAEHKYVAYTVIFINDVTDYCYHDYAMTKKMTADELREAVLNGALVVDTTANTSSGIDNNTPPDKFIVYDTIKSMGRGRNNSTSIDINNTNSWTRYSSEYTKS